jgi:hypothetical protein
MCKKSDYIISTYVRNITWSCLSNNNIDCSNNNNKISPKWRAQFPCVIGSPDSPACGGAEVVIGACIEKKIKNSCIDRAISRLYYNTAYDRGPRLVLRLTCIEGRFRLLPSLLHCHCCIGIDYISFGAIASFFLLLFFHQEPPPITVLIRFFLKGILFICLGLAYIDLSVLRVLFVFCVLCFLWLSTHNDLVQVPRPYSQASRRFRGWS